MSAVATAIAGSAILGALSAPKAPKTLPATNYNAYGEVNKPAEGAINSRDSIFNAINGAGFQSLLQRASGNYAGALSDAANSPLLNSAKGYTGDVLNGSYLNSPIVKGYADQAYNSIIGHGQDQNARTQAQFANNGVGFSTGMQQAQQANSAATANQAATARAGILSGNYQNERQLQQGAVSNSESLVSQTPQYLSQINSALYSPYASQAAITTGLLGSPVNSPQPTYVAQPSTGQQIAGGVGSAAGLYSLLNGLKGATGGGSVGNLAGFDGAVSGSMAGVVCWVAREVYGETNPKWKAFRHWLLTAAPDYLRKTYIARGEQLAVWLKANPEFKPAIRSWMDGCLA